MRRGMLITKSRQVPWLVDLCDFLKICGHLLRYIAKSVHPCTLLAASFRHCRNIASDVTGGIHAASENPRRIRTAMDGSGSKLQQVFSSEKLVVEQRTRMYAVQQAIFKKPTQNCHGWRWIKCFLLLLG